MDLNKINNYLDFLSNDYASEIVTQNLGGSVEKIAPYVGSIYFPSSQFPRFLDGKPNVQLKRTAYLGYIDMFLPDEFVSMEEDLLPAVTVLKFKLDGVERTFVQIAGADESDALGLRFEDFVKSIYPDANKPFSFNKSGVHILSDISLQGFKYNNVEEFFLIYSGNTSVTLGFEFHISVSGFSLLVQ